MYEIDEVFPVIEAAMQMSMSATVWVQPVPRPGQPTTMTHACVSCDHAFFAHADRRRCVASVTMAAATAPPDPPRGPPDASFCVDEATMPTLPTA